MLPAAHDWLAVQRWLLPPCVPDAQRVRVAVVGRAALSPQHNTCGAPKRACNEVQRVAHAPRRLVGALAAAISASQPERSAGAAEATGGGGSPTTQRHRRARQADRLNSGRVPALHSPTLRPCRSFSDPTPRPCRRLRCEHRRLEPLLESRQWARHGMSIMTPQVALTATCAVLLSVGCFKAFAFVRKIQVCNRPGATRGARARRHAPAPPAACPPSWHAVITQSPCAAVL